MIKNYTHTVTERFLRYITIDTQSDPQSNTFPSTEKQKNLSVLLAKELTEMGLSHVETDEFGYVYATIPSNSNNTVSTICFCSHVDTAPDCSGTNVQPILHKNYNGNPIVLPLDAAQVITTEQYPYLKEHIGFDIITASGDTLLGADDKSGVAIIMDLAYYLTTNPDIKHGEIKILFTPDEEVGKGTAKLDMKKLNAEFGYTLDGGEAGTYEDETFSANHVAITIHGVIAHPGDAKKKMVNALKIVGEIAAALPATEWCPEATEKREGFVHPVRIEGIAEKATIEFLIRDFETATLEIHQQRLKTIVMNVLQLHPKAAMDFIVTEQYRNMKEIIVQHPKTIEFLQKAIIEAGLTPKNEPIRGGTDGSRLSFMGLPCPNIFTGMQAIHSKHEWIGVKDLEASVQVLSNLVKIWERG